MAEERVSLWLRPGTHAPIELTSDLPPVRTAIATISLGDDGVVLSVIGEHADGLVVAAFGAGHVPQLCVEALEDLAKRIPVILASRTDRGPVLTHTYGFPGSESDLLSKRLIGAGTWSPIKAKILLHTLLLEGTANDRVPLAIGRYTS